MERLGWDSAHLGESVIGSLTFRYCGYRHCIGKSAPCWQACHETTRPLFGWRASILAAAPAKPSRRHGQRRPAAMKIAYCGAALYALLILLSGADSAESQGARAQVLSPSATPIPRGGFPACPEQEYPGYCAIRYPAGWNLIAGTVRFDGTIRSAWTLEGEEYVEVPILPLRDSGGYWVYLDQPTDAIDSALSLSPHPCPGGGCVAAPEEISVPVDQWAMIGNPTDASVHISGGVFYVYDPTLGQYEQVQTLRRGQGAFVYSSSGEVLFGYGS
jgi:hypothetical protein